MKSAFYVSKSDFMQASVADNTWLGDALNRFNIHLPHADRAQILAGWYWDTPENDTPHGPFVTKKAALEDAHN